MIYPTYPVELWRGQHPLPAKRLAALLLLGRSHQPFAPEWLEQRLAYHNRLAAMDEEANRYRQNEMDWQAMLQQYHVQGEHMAQMLPLYLHQLKLSYRRQMQDRKSERFYERIDYVRVESWFFDESAYYFEINTWDGLPYGLSSKMFLEPEIADTLSLNFGSKCTIEKNPGDDEERPGLWIIVEHRAGRGLVPRHVSFQKLFGVLPKTAGPLAWPIGQAANGRVLIGNLADLYHLGIGGQTGGGKSNQINCILGSLLSRNTPEQLRLFLVDFKKVELSFYKVLPHLGGDVRWVNRPLLLDEESDSEEEEDPILLHTIGSNYSPKNGEKLYDPMGKQIVTSGKNLLQLLDYILSEIYRRLAKMEGRVKKISQWNKQFNRDKMSEWVLVIDELGDIMLQPGINKRVERRLVRILQLGRAAGIHCILATQTPKNIVITSLIQNNLTAWVVTRTGNGPASGLMLDGKHDAAKLPVIPGRIIFRHGGELTQVQTPEITDMTIRQIVAQAKAGQVATLDAAHQKVPPEIFFGFALNELSGYCSERDLFERFKGDGITRDEVRQVLRDYTVAGSPPALEPEIEIDGNLYYLTPYITGSNRPRQLLPVDQFITEFDQKWAQYLHGGEKAIVRRAPCATENVDQMTGQNLKPGKNGQAKQPHQPDNFISQRAPLAVAAEQLPDDLPDWLR